MQLKDELQMMLMAIMMIMMMMKYDAVAAASHRRLPHIPACGPECAHRPLGVLRPNYGDDDEFKQWSVHRADTKIIFDGGRSQDPAGQRHRRSLRPTKTVELAETSHGQLLTLGSDYAERFAFEDPSPHQLDISAVMGNILLRDGHRLDYETEPEIEFVVIVTRVDDVAREYCMLLFVL